jgi:DNA-binding MarR family transcriptional regulator
MSSRSITAFACSYRDEIMNIKTDTSESSMPDETEKSHVSKFAPVRAISTISREFDKVCRDASVSITQYRFMLYLKDGPRRAGEVAATSLVTKATISGHITILRDKGWITAETDTVDRRVTRLVLTDSGRMAMQSFESQLLDCLKSLIRPEDRERVLSDLAGLYAALSATRESRYADFESNAYQYVVPSADLE